MLWVDGLRLGSRTRFALDQSTNSALSRASQNLRSCASDLNRGSLVFAVINLPFLSRVSRVTTVSGSVVPAIMDRLYVVVYHGPGLPTAPCASSKPSRAPEG